MVNSQNKGKRYERDIARYLTDKFRIDVRRTPNSGGLSIKGDIIGLSGILSRFEFELKNQEKLNIWKALQQVRDYCMYKTPLVIFTKNNEDSYVAIQIDEFFNLLLEIEQLEEKLELYKEHVEVDYKGKEE